MSLADEFDQIGVPKDLRPKKAPVDTVRIKKSMDKDFAEYSEAREFAARGRPVADSVARAAMKRFAARSDSVSDAREKAKKPVVQVAKK